MTIRRRTFVKGVAAAGLAAGVGLPRLARAQSANGKLNIACIGTANQARFSIDSLRGENLVAFADVDSFFLARAGDDFPGAATFGDYRRMLDAVQGSIDAVVVAVPDHHHAQAGLRALALGKHLYCEKPLAHSVREVRFMREAAASAGVATQMGTQIHASDHYRRMVALLRGGAIGTVREVHIWDAGAATGSRIPDRDDPVPDTLDWKLWLGPAPDRAYHPKIYHPFNWRGWWDFGGGTLSDIACHVVDLAHWALGLGCATAATAKGADPMPQRAPRSLMVEYEYAASHAANGGGPVRLTWYHGNAWVRTVNVRQVYNVPESWRGGRNILFVGDRGKLLTDYDNHVVFDADDPNPAVDRSLLPAPSPGHHAEWVAAAKGGPASQCNFDYAGTLTESVLLGLVSHRAGNVRIEYDATTGRVTNNADANVYITKPYRHGWDIDALI